MELLENAVQNADSVRCATLASPEPSEHQSVDFDGPMNIFYSSECLLKSVTAYMGNAVVCRSVKPQVRKNSTSLLVFKRLPVCVDPLSFRVEILAPSDLSTDDEKPSGTMAEKKERPVRFRLEGPGSAYIQDVTFHTTQPNENERELADRQHAVLQSLIKANRKCHVLYTRFQRLSTQQNVLESFASSLMSRPSENVEYDDPFTMDVETRQSRSSGRTKRLTWGTRSLSRRRKASEKNRFTENPSRAAAVTTNESLQLAHIEAMQNFFSLYNSKTQQLDEDVARVGEELELSQMEVEELEQQLRQLNRCHDEFTLKELHVLLESRGTDSPEMELSYSVGGVSWMPAYDIRLSSAAATLQIIYYGIVTQCTGENWDLGTLTLSTAQPAQGGGVPELALERLAFKDVESSTDAGIRRKCRLDRSKRNIKARSLHADDILTDRLPPIDEMQKCRLDESIKFNCRGLEHGLHSLNCESNAYFLRKNKEWSFNAPVRPKQWVGLNPPQQFSSVGANVEEELISNIERSRNQSLIRHNNLTTDPNSIMSSMDESTLLHRTTPSGTGLGRQIDPFCWLPSDVHEQQRSCGSAVPNSQFPSLTFEVERPPTSIRGNGDPHRVTLGTLEFRPTLEYITIPKLLPKAFLRARMHNISEFALLQGPASVYIDNCFNGKTEIPATVVQEELTCNLGIDSGVQVTYKPRHKYKKTGSYIGGKTMSITFTQVIGVTNTYPRSLHILVVDQLPISSEEKVKVQLLEPPIKHPEKYDPTKPVRINKLKMVEWDVKLGPYESRELVLKYLVEHPISKDINITSIMQN